MCYASPGPRCEKHARDRVNATRTKNNVAFLHLKDADDDLKDYVKENPHDTSSDKFKILTDVRAEKLEKFEVAAQKHREAQDEMDATKGGLANLRTELAACLDERSDRAEERAAEINQLISKASATYNRKMGAYDDKFGTVDGRAPSPYGSPRGIAMLQEKRQKLAQAYSKETTEQGKREAYDKYHANNKALDHAKMTYDRVKQGRTDPDKASYRENREQYKDIVKRHVAAGEKLHEMTRPSNDADKKLSDDAFLAKRAEARKAFNKIQEEKFACEAKLTRARFKN